MTEGENAAVDSMDAEVPSISGSFGAGLFSPGPMWSVESKSKPTKKDTPIGDQWLFNLGIGVALVLAVLAIAPWAVLLVIGALVILAVMAIAPLGVFGCIMFNCRQLRYGAVVRRNELMARLRAGACMQHIAGKMRGIKAQFGIADVLVKLTLAVAFLYFVAVPVLFAIVLSTLAH